MSVTVETQLSAFASALGPGRTAIYLSHPLTTGRDTIPDNIKKAAALAADIKLRLGRPVINPTVATWDGWSHADWMALWLEVISRHCCEVVMAPGWEASKGCVIEHDHAKANKIPIYYES